MSYIGEAKVRFAFEEELGKFPDAWWDIVKPFLPLEHMERGDFRDYLKPVTESLSAIKELVK